MFYCVTSIYRVGGNVTRNLHTVQASVKPDDKEEEFPYHVVIDKYFNTEDEARAYLEEVEKIG